LKSCLILSDCAEDSDCVINEDCYLNSDLCSGGVCDFDDMNVSAKVYVFYSGDDGGSLELNLSGDLQFFSGNSFVFFGKRALNGGDGGAVNISVSGLFNTSQAVFIGNGGGTSGVGIGGDGGRLQINYWGLIRKFTDADHSPFVSNSPNLAGGSGLPDGEAGSVIYNKDTDKLINGERDVDINNDGYVC